MLSNQLGVPVPATQQLPDATRISMLEEVLPYLERQWSMASKSKSHYLDTEPDDALSAQQRLSLQAAVTGTAQPSAAQVSAASYVQRLESTVLKLSGSGVVFPTFSAEVAAMDLSFSGQYLTELEECVAELEGAWAPADSRAW